MPRPKKPDERSEGLDFKVFLVWENFAISRLSERLKSRPSLRSSGFLGLGMRLSIPDVLHRRSESLVSSALSVASGSRLTYSVSVKWHVVVES